MLQKALSALRRQQTRSTLCPKCYKDIGYRRTAKHFMEVHPEIKFTCRHDATGQIHYLCGLCDRVPKGHGCFSDLVNHYKTCHNLVKEIDRPQVLDTARIDELLSGVDQSTALSKSLQVQNAKLEASFKTLHLKVIQYAARIVELQNQIANSK